MEGPMEPTRERDPNYLAELATLLETLNREQNAFEERVTSVKIELVGNPINEALPDIKLSAEAITKLDPPVLERLIILANTLIENQHRIYDRFGIIAVNITSNI